MANTKMTGEISEAIVIAEFLKSGLPVLLPFGDNQRYDMVVEVDGRFLGVQCKTARALRGGAVLCFKTKSTNFAEDMAGQLDADAALDRMATVLAGATGAVRVQVWVRVGSQLRPRVTWPHGSAPPAAVSLVGHQRPRSRVSRLRLPKLIARTAGPFFTARYRQWL